MSKTALFVGATLNDLVLRCGGTMAQYSKDGYEVHAVALTDNVAEMAAGTDRAEYLAGQREAGEKIRRTLGIASLELWEMPALPFAPAKDDCERMAVKMRQVRPEFIVTHAKLFDPFCPDNMESAVFTLRSFMIAAATGAYCNGEKVANRKCPMFGMEPHRSEKVGFKADIFVDITEVEEQKTAAAALLCASTESIQLALERDMLRGGHAKGRGGRKNCKYAEAYSMYAPVCVHDAFVW